MKRVFARLILSAVIILMAVPAFAHPHVYADVRVQVQFDETGQVYAIDQQWLFDEFYSVFATSGADMDGDGKPDQNALDAVLAENMSHLEDYHYFTRVMSGDTRITTGKATNATTRVIDNRLEMSFRLPVTAPVAIRDMPLRYAIYDPTYYIEMVHAETDQAITLVNAPTGCRAVMKQPNPDPEQIMLAASLDRTQSAGDGLGQFFAEDVSLTCD
ncbi:MAG: DUF1007 family protein [Rhodospirillales bacterium]